jgi:2,4-dienoyl-CoA reductase-like NADH-dependent reductase (Old Yellow Enzyme family)
LANEPDIPRFHGAQALAGWQRVIDAEHGASGNMGPQLWHMGAAAVEQGGKLLRAAASTDPTPTWNRLC